MAIVEQAEGRQSKLVWIKESTFGTKEGTPSGFALPHVGMDLGPGEGFTDFEEIDAVAYPAKPMGTRKAPGGRLSLPLHYDSIGHAFAAAIATPVTTGASDPYEHVFTLGASDPHDIEIERQQNDTGLGVKSRHFWAGRVASMSYSMAVESAPQFDLDLAFCKAENWTNTAVVASPSSYTSDAIDSLIGVLKIGGSAVGYVAAFSFTIDWRLDTDKYPVGNEGDRGTLSRGRPMVNGTCEAYLNADGVTALLTPSQAGTSVAFDVEFITTASTRELLIDINSADLKITSEGVPTSGGVNVAFDWRAYGSGCFVATLYNDVASY
jgi:hypothetical protein